MIKDGPKSFLQQLKSEKVFPYKNSALPLPIKNFLKYSGISNLFFIC